MKCDDLREMVSAYADGELDGVQRDFVETHLKSCPDCQAVLTQYRHAGYKLSSLRYMPQTANIGPKTMSQIKSLAPAPKRRWIWRPAFIGMPIAIALVITLIVNLPGGDQPITASALIRYVIENSSNIKSFRSDGTSTLTVHMQPGDAVTSVKSTNIIDLAAQRSYTAQTTSTTSITGTVSNGNTTVRYYSDGYVYQIYDNPQASPPVGMALGQWYKTKVPEELWAFQFHTLDDNRDSLITWLYFDPVVEIIGSESINGIDCYKISITPDLLGIIAKYNPDSIQPKFTDVKGFGWIEKSTFNLVKSELSYNMSSPDGISMFPDGPVSFSNSIYYSLINKASVVLPPEVQNAIERVIPPTDPTTVDQAISKVKLASGSLDSFYLKSTSTTGVVTTTIAVEADIKNNIFHFTQSANRYDTGVTEYYFLPDATYVKSDYPAEGMGPGVWYRLPPTNKASLPPLVLFQQRIISALESSSLVFGSGSVNDIPSYAFNFLDKGGMFISPNPNELSNVRFYVMAEKENSRIILVVIDFTWTQNGQITTTHQQIDVSRFDQVSVVLPPEVSGALTIP